MRTKALFFLALALALAMPVMGQERCEAISVPFLMDQDLRREGLPSKDIFPVIDLLALVIPGAGSIADLKGYLETDVQQLNQVLQNSQVRGMVRLVGVAPSPPSQSYRPSDSSSDFLFSVAADPEVDRVRNEYGADLVTFIVADGMIGSVPGAGFITLDPYYGYSAISAASLPFSPLFLAHEIGHNLGLPHDKANGPPDGGPFAPKAWGHWGTLLDGTSFNDVMSYPSACPDLCRRQLPFYGNPDVVFEGVPMGIVGEREGALWVNQISMPLVAAYRLPKVGDCVPTTESLCLRGSRFRVEAAWEAGGGSGHGTAVPLTNETGYFWFFNEANLEVVVKLLDGCGLNKRFWTFAAGLTNVKVTLTVTDTTTGKVKVYTNPQGQAFRPIQDTDAFSTCQ